MPRAWGQPSKTLMVVRGKASAVGMLAAVLIMVLALVYTAFNRTRRANPAPPLHASPSSPAHDTHSR